VATAHHHRNHDRNHAGAHDGLRFDGAPRLDVDRAGIRRIDDLARLSVEQLAVLYAFGHPPQLGVLAGRTRGRILAFPAVRALPWIGGVFGGRVARLVDHGLRGFATTRLMPWRGKRFAPPGEHHRTRGSNEILGRALLPFDAHVEKSAIDRAPTLRLRYDHPENPRMLRPMAGELREVARGLWLGLVHVQGPSGPLILCWWAIAKD
jgi:hypothetical protein